MTTTEQDFLSYLCAGVSVLTAFLFGLPGLGASCGRVAAGSAGRPECLPSKNAMCMVGEVSKRGILVFGVGIFGFSYVRCREQSGIVCCNGHHGIIVA